MRNPALTLVVILCSTLFYTACRPQHSPFSAGDIPRFAPLQSEALNVGNRVSEAIFACGAPCGIELENGQIVAHGLLENNGVLEEGRFRVELDAHTAPTSLRAKKIADSSDAAVVRKFSQKLDTALPEPMAISASISSKLPANVRVVGLLHNGDYALVLYSFPWRQTDKVEEQINVSVIDVKHGARVYAKPLGFDASLWIVEIAAVQLVPGSQNHEFLVLTSNAFKSWTATAYWIGVRD